MKYTSPQRRLLTETDEQRRRLERQTFSDPSDEDARFRHEVSKRRSSCSHEPGIRKVKCSEDLEYNPEPGDYGVYSPRARVFTLTCRVCKQELEREERSVWHEEDQPEWCSEDKWFKPGLVMAAYHKYRRETINKQVGGDRYDDSHIEDYDEDGLNLGPGIEPPEDEDDYDDYDDYDDDDEEWSLLDPGPAPSLFGPQGPD